MACETGLHMVYIMNGLLGHDGFVRYLSKHGHGVDG